MTSSWTASLAIVEARLDRIRAAIDAQALSLPPLPWLLAPPVIRSEERARIASVCEAVHRALVVVADVAGEEELPLPAKARALMPPGDDERRPLRICRLDALYDPDVGAESLRFVEVQAGDPSGPGWNDVVVEAWHRAGVLDALGVAPRFTTDALLTTAGAVAGLDRVAFACPDASFVVTDHDAMAARARAAGYNAVRVAPRALAGAKAKTDVIVRDSHDDLDDVDAAALAGALMTTRYVNPIRDVRFDDKRCFALLRDRLVRPLLDAEAAAAVDAFVPWTFEVDDAIRARLERNRAFVLKPADGYGGFGVVVGPHVDDDTWAAAIDASRTRPTVAQEAVSTAPQPWPVLVDGRIEVVPRFTTWSFWMHDGRMTEAFVRAGAGAVVNVHQGGGLGPVLFAP